MAIKYYAACVLFGLLSFGCEQPHSSALTPGGAKKYIKRGVTTQAEVIETFGTPNIVTQKNNYEMWVYDKISSKQKNAAFGLGGIGGGAGSGGFGGGGLAGGASSSERSETTIMLIIYFDNNDVVHDYKMNQTKF